MLLTLFEMEIISEDIKQLIETYRGKYIFLLYALFLAYVSATVIRKVRSNFPPGPIGLPFVGYLPFLTRNVHLDLIQLGKKYGELFSIKLGSQDIVILNGPQAVTEALNKPEFLGRPPISALQKAAPSSAFFDSNIHLWKEQRKFLIQSMKDLGLFKSKIEENIMEEINHFMDVLRNSETQPVDITKPLCCSVLNNICSFLFGKLFEYDDPNLQFLYMNLEIIFKHFNPISVDVLFPWIRYIPFACKFLQSRKTRTAVLNLELFFLKEFKEHIKAFNPADVRDYMDRYIVEIDKQRAKHPDSSFNQNMLISNSKDILIAASETTIGSLLWFIYIIAAFPDVQKKVQEEIMEVIGPDKTIEYMDMKNMPYTRAVILEVMRWKPVSPLSLVHYTLADITVSGYNLPKGTTAIVNFWASHHDLRYWEEPEKFNPERFLSKDGKRVLKPSYFVPFLVGKRVCPGESMANLELFLYSTSILRRFDLSFSEETQPTFNGVLNTMYRPEPYFVRFIPKN